MEIRKSRNKNEIYSFLSRNKGLYLYLIGDLDDFFWPHTTWYIALVNGKIEAAALLYSGMAPSTFLLFHEGDLSCPEEMIRELLPELPEEFNVHLSPGLLESFGKENIIRNYGRNSRMILVKEPVHITDEKIRRLERTDLAEIEKFYQLAYPANWFDSRMLETGKYFGYFDKGILAGIAGIHVYSPEYRIAALGNIATHPEFRGRKIAFKLTSVLCSDLRKDTDTIGLNVSSANTAAIKCYENAGFEIRGSYDECFIRNI
jgi:ribosomal protein S18 acetylase RimI-like enzyme